MKKKYSFILAALTLFTVCKTQNATAQISGSGAYVPGNYVELGIDSLGGFEGSNTLTAPVPAGMHPRGGSGVYLFGFVANPQMNSWASYDGDYFTPGSPENGWGFEIGTSGQRGSNNCVNIGASSGDEDIRGHITSWSFSSPYYSVDWEGSTPGGGLHFKINYLLGMNDVFYTTTVWVRNDSTDTIPDLYFYRNVDPDNNQSINGDFTTQNTIVDQSPAFGGSTVATVTASQALPAPSIFAFIGDTNFVAGYGGFSNRDASDMFNGTGFTQSVGSSYLGDEAVYLACHIQNLVPGDSSLHTHRSMIAQNEYSFRFISTFDTSSVVCAQHAMNVNQTSYPDLTTGSPAFALSGGSPAGGTYIGTGVSGGMFDPAVSGPGDFDIIYSYTDGTGCTGAAVSTIHVSDISAGIHNQTAVQNATLYPNPFSNEAVLSVGKNVQLQNAELHVYDVLGKEVKTIATINTNEIRIDRKELPAGMYFYRLINKGSVVANGRMIVK